MEREKCGGVDGGIGGWHWLWEEEGETFCREEEREKDKREKEACGGSSLREVVGWWL